MVTQTSYRIRQALAGHAAVGLLAGALLYIMLLTGTLAVIQQRWQVWEQPDAPRITALSAQAVQRALVREMAAAPATGTVLFTLPAAEWPRATVTSDAGEHYLEPDGGLAQPVLHPWIDFVLALHEYLTLPASLGLVVVGTLGVMMLVLSITGIVAHPRIFRDAFRLRARGPRQLAQTDWHNRLGVWTLPFAFAVSLTGAVLGLSALEATMVAHTYHGGDLNRTYAAIFGDFGATRSHAAPVADVATALETMRRRFPDATPTYVTIEAPGTANQRVTILGDAPRRLIYGESYRFDADGRFIGKVGLSDGAIGQQAAASAYKLHFGNFGGLPVELAYLMFGLSLTAIAASGTSLWLQKRRRRGLPSPRLEAMWSVIVWGVPALLALAYLTTTIGLGASGARDVFWAGIAVSLGVAALNPAFCDRQYLRIFAAMMLPLAVLANLFAVGIDDLDKPISLSIAAIASAFVLIWRSAPGRPARAQRG